MSARRMREAAARAVESDAADDSVRFDANKHHSVGDWSRDQRASAIRALPLPHLTEVEVERAARAAYSVWDDSDSGWNYLPRSDRGFWGEIARAAIAAYEGGGA